VEERIGPIARCTRVERLIRRAGLHGARRGRRCLTTGLTRPPDLLNRNFSAQAPNRLWILDVTYVPTWSGMALHRVRLRRVLPPYPRLADQLLDPTELLWDALEMALWTRSNPVTPRRRPPGRLDPPRTGRHSRGHAGTEKPIADLLSLVIDLRRQLLRAGPSLVLSGVYQSGESSLPLVNIGLGGMSPRRGMCQHRHAEKEK
jgi:hypothetical protein